MDWWIWIVAACVLGIAEMLIPLDFYLLFLGAAAFIVGLLVALFEQLGMAELAWLQWALFAGIALLLLVFGRRLARRYIDTSEGLGNASEIEGQEVEIQARIGVGDTGRGLAKGTSWNVRNLDDTPLEAGDRCQVVRRAGLTLDVNKVR